jgi:type VI secretion system protein ImpB
MTKNRPSTPPPERITVSQPAPPGGGPREELPFKLMVLGDFTGKQDDMRLEDREPIEVNKDNFDSVLKAQNLTLDIAVENKLVDEEGVNMPISLSFESMRDFGPDRVAEQVPELEKLLKLREQLKTLKGPLANIPEFRKKVQELIKDDAILAQMLEDLNLKGTED